MRRTLGWWWGAIAIALTGCNDGRNVAEEDAASQQASLECSLLFDCACMPIYESEQACYDERWQTYEGMWAPLRGSGLYWDGTCLGDYLDALESRGCAPFEALPPGSEEIPDQGSECQAPCAPYHGDVGKGQACLIVSAPFSNCAQGLMCFEDECVDPCEGFANALAAGEACRDGFEVLGECGEGLVCDAGASDTCIALPGPGAPCPQGVCAEGSWCQQIVTDTMCVALLGNGQACSQDPECVSSYCREGFCTPVPGENEPCTDRCSETLSCVSGVCGYGAEQGQSCASAPCVFGLVCIEGVCDAGPGEGQPCINGQCALDFECGAAGVCVRRPAAVCSAL